MRGERTRGALLEAARSVFERDGFLNARVADIVAEAGVAHGTFYTYFGSKEEVFKEVAISVVDEVLSSLRVSRDHGTTKERISAANERYLTVFQKHAVMLGLIDQVATFNDDFRALRLDLRNRFVDRIAPAIERLALESPNSEPLDSRTAASALGGMVDNFGHTWFVLGEHFDWATALKTIDTIWFRTLKLE